MGKIVAQCVIIALTNGVKILTQIITVRVALTPPGGIMINCAPVIRDILNAKMEMANRHFTQKIVTRPTELIDHTEKNGQIRNRVEKCAEFLARFRFLTKNWIFNK